MQVDDPVPGRELVNDEPAGPPPLQIVPWLRVRSFEREDSGRVVRVTLVGELRSRSRAPKQASLVVRRGELATAFRPTRASVERSGSLRPGTRAALRWIVTFSLPPALVEDPRATFRLLCEERAALDLPIPTAPAVELAAPVGRRRTAGVFASAAVVSTAALMISPAASLASSGAPPTGTSASTATTSAAAASTTSATAAATTSGSTTPTSQSTATPTTGAGTTGTSASGTGTPTPPPTDTTPTPTPPPTDTTPTPTPPPTDTTPTPTPPPTDTTTTTTPPPTDTTTTTTPPPTTTTPPPTTPSTTTPPTTSTTPPPAPRPKTKPIIPAPTWHSPTNTGSSSADQPSASSQETSKPHPKSSSQQQKSTVHEDASKVKTPAKPQRTAKTGRKSADACPPATLQLYRIAGRTGRRSSNCTNEHPKNQSSNDNITSTGPGSKPVYISPNVVALTPVTVPSSSGEWGGSAMSNPFTPEQLQRYSQLVGKLSRPPQYLVRIYKAAARRYRLPWPILAAINYVETGYGADVNNSSAGAIGWMQFMPGTWRAYGESVDVRGQVMAHVAANPWNPRDAIFSAARYLVAHGAHKDLPQSIFAYNHALWYVEEVLSVAQQIDRQGMKPGTQAGKKVAAMSMMARLLNGLPYIWGGGHSSWGASAGYDCSGFVSQILHAGGYLSEPVTTQSLPVQNGIVSGPGRWISIFDRTDGGGLSSDHVIININGQWWESGGSSSDGGAGDVHRVRNMNATYLSSFNLVLHPRGL